MYEIDQLQNAGKECQFPHIEWNFQQFLMKLQQQQVLQVVN